LKNGSVNFAGEIDAVINKYLGEQEIDSQQPIADINNRKGNGIMRFTDINFIDNKGTIRNTFAVGEEMTVRVFFQASDKFVKADKSRIDVGINNILDARVTWMSTFMYMDRVDGTKKYVDFKINKLMLNEGVYNFNLYCETNLGIADHITNASKMNIVFHDYYLTGRTVVARNIGYVITDFRVV